ncbi:hypothetical protein SMUDGE_8 [Bacillus phage Smudge]|uniref:Uncharacterized protein n=3 Tax=Wphvirus megatron TaxID=1987728 RepID=A0A173H2B9_9CAUD|nr:hypothetical protein SAGEFAYGE_8 [Bacillus phage SageFayge]YP_009284950.1 hypothetical protein BIZ88_gp008 [Bacillus phage DirtyBetty]ANI24627.1 hypothetical protein SMUDGE_8 [Bacillus phage Smudge]ASR79321.1 hypothetical protein ZAINNY_8 [Bacillus phage Zainny]AMW62929.1 hypothetical protein SAGEFAYGE_8 [Bacillus phage SageFayge]ANT41519.1 hypothetical protein DIRTYBETTY_8 [Bacillus phage DirtyBetty]
MKRRKPIKDIVYDLLHEGLFVLVERAYKVVRRLD